MTCGIYCYKDTQNDNEVIYVGKDSSIDTNTRHKKHNYPSRYNQQVINRVLQNNPDRYTYHVLKEGDFDEKLLSALEILYVHRYSPKFNFTIGGDGMRGYKHSEESKRKIKVLNLLFLFLLHRLIARYKIIYYTINQSTYYCCNPRYRISCYKKLCYI